MAFWNSEAFRPVSEPYLPYSLVLFHVDTLVSECESPVLQSAALLGSCKGAPFSGGPERRLIDWTRFVGFIIMYFGLRVRGALLFSVSGFGHSVCVKSIVSGCTLRYSRPRVMV